MTSAPPTAVTAGLVQSMIVAAQRRVLDGIGRAVGTEVVYLKAAWADPVLYGGRGERTGGDIDILVRPGAVVAFAGRLEAQGYRLFWPPWQRATILIGNHAWVYQPPPGWLPVDLHLGLADPPWFSLPVAECLDRAIVYDSVDGPILSLCPEDQILHAAAHYANHAYTIDGRHLGDVERLCTERRLDWGGVWERARQGGLEVPLALLTQALSARGMALPVAARPCGVLTALCIARSKAWVATAPELRRKGPLTRTYDKLARFPFLSNRSAALPRYLARYAFVRLADVALELAYKLGEESQPR